MNDLEILVLLSNGTTRLYILTSQEEFDSMLEKIQRAIGPINSHFGNWYEDTDIYGVTERVNGCNIVSYQIKAQNNGR